MIKCAIIVTYEPEMQQLKKIIQRIKQANFIPIIVDNSEKKVEKFEHEFPDSIIVSMEGNRGIAHAQNAGIARAVALNAQRIAFFDQDSDIDAELIEKLENYIEEKGMCVTVPVALEKDTLLEYPVQKLNCIGFPKDVYVKNKKHPQKVDIVISSGTMMNMKIIENVGGFDEDFFIDFVDVEWCLRCKKAEIPIYVLPDAILYHKIGNKTIDIAKMEIIVHSPIRTYYKVRNSFLLLYKKVNLLFTIRQILPAVFHNFLLIFQVENKKEYLKYYLLGIGHGICGVKGKYEKGKS